MIIYAKIYEQGRLEEIRAYSKGSILYFKHLSNFDIQINGLESLI